MFVRVLKNDDAGEYQCIATNEAGSSEAFAYLPVRSKLFSLRFKRTYELSPK